MSMTYSQLAAGIGISKSMVARHVKRGMPTDSVESAQRWRTRTLDPARRKSIDGSGRVDGNPGVTARPQGELLELAHGIADLMDSAPRLMRDGAPHLRSVLASMHQSTLDKVRLSLGVWDELTGLGG